MDLADRLAVAFAESGMPPLVGRVLAHLLCCEPPAQSLGDLAAALGASKGGLSQATRLLVQLQILERASVPGSRQVGYRLRDDAWLAHMRGDMVRLRGILSILDDGLRELADAPPARTRRLREMRALYAFYDRKLPELLAEWLELRARGEVP
jgi:hypothetical protein